MNDYSTIYTKFLPSSHGREMAVCYACLLHALFLPQHQQANKQRKQKRTKQVPPCPLRPLPVRTSLARAVPLSLWRSFRVCRVCLFNRRATETRRLLKTPPGSRHPILPNRRSFTWPSHWHRAGPGHDSFSSGAPVEVAERAGIEEGSNRERP